ncbi:DNA-binding beta-propeller fold protein YncE [Lutibacter agarilyticus]|uniref:DNA-binding beta-propeller fold protein YncE n=1 Tax=Lutibacter agarilyticus TaxID=1109740 RepID=A0A238WIJ5_9FLAO|nr:FG-GAP-like repeat-containing protein [Lutibacter agarilyticus]SNR46143.1 DNA-binding beta-propeller fold protein YncE [Lutibacter agarilyticus]
MKKLLLFLVFSIFTFPSSVFAQNEVPTAITLSALTVDENLAIDTEVGVLTTTDADVSDTFTYALISGTGDTDNASFTISGDQLLTAESFDFETKTSYEIRIETNDGNGGIFSNTFTISVNDIFENQTPTAIALSASTVDENSIVGTEVATLTSAPVDGSDTFTYELVVGDGSTDNASFTISGDKLLTAESFDFETKATYDIRIETDDSNGGTFSDTFTITVNDINDSPTAIALSALTVDENLDIGTEVGAFTTTDADVSDTFTYTLVVGTGDADNASFTISGDKLLTAESFDFETKDSYEIRVETNDGTATFSDTFTITVNDVFENQLPAVIVLSVEKVDENLAIGTAVATLTSFPVDGSDTFTYTLVAGAGDTDNTSFTISEDQLLTKEVFDFETKDSYEIRIETNDGNGGIFSDTFTITVNDVFENQAPTAIALSVLTIDENLAIDTEVGTFTTTDADVADTFTYTLVTGTGDTDNTSFTISGDKLLTAASFDFETKVSYKIRVETSDGTDVFSDTFTITVNDINDTPTAIALSSLTIDEDLNIGTEIGSLTSTDVDSSNFTYSLVAGDGDTDNTSFTISGDKLLTNEVFDFETKDSYEIRVETNDGTDVFSDTFTITINDIVEIRDISGVISTNTTWRAVNNPYTIVGHTQISAGATLTIEPDVEVNFMGDRKIVVNGNININGTDLSHVTFNGNSTVGSTSMILFQSANLNNSSINYVDFTGPQRAIQLADESSNIQDEIKNTNSLNVNNCTFTNTGVATKGIWNSAELNIENSIFNSCSLQGYNYSDFITLRSCVINSSIIDFPYSRGVKIYNSHFASSSFKIYGEWYQSSFLIDGSKIYNSNFSGYEGDISINKTILVDSPLNLPQNDVEISNSVISFDGTETYQGMEGQEMDIQGVYSRKATITNTLITGRGAGTGVEIYDYNNYQSTISNSIITNNTTGIKVTGTYGVFDFQNNNFTKNKEYALNNQNNNNITATNNYWGTIDELEVEDLIYHSPDDVFSNIGIVTFTPILSIPNTTTSTVISPPLNIAKVPSGSDVVLTWTPNSETSVIGYKLYYGDPTGLSYSNVIDLGNVNTYTLVGGLIDTEYALTAYTTTADGVDDQIEGFESWFSLAKEPKVSLSVAEELVNEEVGVIIITAAMETVLPYDTTVNLTTTGTATLDTDYTISSNTITIPAGSLSSTAEVTVLTDALVEFDETIVVAIESVVNASEDGEQQITLNIENVNDPIITLAISATTIGENESFTITATIDAPISKDVVIDLESVGEAKYDTDFTSNSVIRISTVAGGNGRGSANNQLYNPRGVFVDATGNMYITEAGYSRIKKWNKGATQGEVIINGVSDPIDVYVDEEGAIYVLERGLHQVRKFVLGDTTGIVVAGGNDYGSDSNQLRNPTGFFVDEVGNIYIADSDNQRIQKWEPGAAEGITVAGGNGQGNAANQLSYPNAVSIDSEGNIYIADSENNRVQKWGNNSTKGETIISNFNYPTDIYVNDNGAIYIVSPNNSLIKKFELGMDTGVVVAGGNGSGSAENQLAYPYNFIVDTTGNIYVSDSENSRIQKYDISPQIIIKSGETTAELTVSGIEDTRDELDETIILNTTASNAVLGSADPIAVTLTDINEPPTVAFTFSEEKITENSDTDVTLTATVSSVSAKDVAVTFTLEGSAIETTDYVVSSTTIAIPANSSKGTLTISTKDLDDVLVEVLDSIVFKVNTITNATALVDKATLLLESDDDPNVVITTSTDVIAEHETFNIIATLDYASSKDVMVSLESIGTAIYDGDFKRNTPVEISTVAGGNSYGNAANQLYNPRGVFVDAMGNVYIADHSNGNIKKWIPGATEGEIVITSGNPIDVFVDVNGNIYALEIYENRVTKWIPGASSGEVVAGGNSHGTADNQLAYPQGFYIDEMGNIFVADTNNHRIQKWEPGAIEGITVAGGNEAGNGNNQLSSPQAVFVDGDGNIYVADTNNNRIQKWAPNAIEGETVIAGINYPTDIHIDLNENIYVLDQNSQSVLKYPASITSGIVVAGGNGYGSEANQFNNAYNFTVDAIGNIYVSDYSNHRVQKYEASLQVIVKAGDTEGSLTLSGIEDELNEEGDEYIVIKKTGTQNAILTEVEDLSVTLLDNTKTLALKSSPFMGLSEGAVSWGDYDRDGDKDVAIMGQSNILGAVTLLYENVDGEFVDTNQNFAKLYGGDITWVDLNKDGWIDLVVSGFDGSAPQTKVYMNNGGTYFEPTNGYGLPKLFSTKMAWGDLDNDGDIDLAIAGQDAANNYVFDVYYKEDTSNNFEKELLFNHEGFINGDLKIVDLDLDGDNDIIYNGQNSSGNPSGGYILNSYIRTTNTNSNWQLYEELRLKNSSIEVAKINDAQNELVIISSGEDSNGSTQLYTNTLNSDYYYSNIESLFPKLKNGDISIADYNNDGNYDVVLTGESQEGVPVTKLFKQNSNGFVDSEIELKGLRESTATWVDYDMDGDLDLFLTGIGSSGAETLLYETEIANKKNAAPAQISGLVAEDLGNGKIRFKWDLPSDDYATNLGYVIRVGTTPGGTELSNTESDLTTGIRLISKAPPIYTNFYDMQLDPGNYYWSVQAVDPGLKGSEFSDEDSFTLVYEWKILNQGGIVDRSVQGVADPVLKLGDVDNDNDLDVIYGSETGSETQLLKFDGKQLIKENSNPFGYINSITNSEVGDINGDGVADILINHWVNSNYQLKIYLSNGSGYSPRNVGNGLYKAKAKIIDLNNDGQAEIFLVGMSSSSISGVPKLYLYEYNPVTSTFNLDDVSSQIDPLQYASYDLGDIDNDQDIDFIISGFNASTGIQSFIYENVTELGGEFTLQKTTNNLVAVKNGTTDLIDFDGDGDLDAVFTGESKVSDVFEIYMNKLNEGISEWPRLANGLSPMRDGKIDLGDFDGDGYTDLLYSGTFEGIGDITKLSEYDAATKTYVESAFDVSDIIKAEVEFGDLDGDGDLDFVIAGKSAETNGGNIFRTYINVRNQSAEVLGKPAGKRPKYAGKSSAKSSATITEFVVNNAPSVPVVNDIVFLEGTDGSVDIPLEFSWNPATDDHTPSVGLTYAIKIGTTPGGEDVMSSNSNSNGVKKDAEKGNVEHNLKWKLSLPEGTYYWSVQAVDASYSGSEFTTPVQFKVTATGIDSDSDGDGIENSLDICPNTPKGDAVDQNGCSVNALLGDSNGDEKVTVTDLVLNVNYILGLNPIPFVFKAADVNNDEVVDILDIVGTVDIILSPASKNNNSKDEWNYYSNIPIDDALFYWEGNDLYVSSNEAIAGMQLVFDTDFDYDLSQELSNFDRLNFSKEADQTIMIYSFSGISIEPGITKLLTKFDNNEVSLDVEKSAAGTPKGMKLAVKFDFNELITPTESFKLGPNPSNGFMTLYHYLPEERDLLLIRAYNLNGVMVWSSDKIKSSLGQGVNPINLEFLNDGVYFLVIEAFKQGEIKEKEVKQIIIRK